MHNGHRASTPIVHRPSLRTGVTLRNAPMFVNGVGNMATLKYAIPRTNGSVGRKSHQHVSEKINMKGMENEKWAKNYFLDGYEIGLPQLLAIPPYC